MLTVTNIQSNYRTNQTNLIVLVHLYRDSTNYEAYSTADIYLDSKFYRGVIDDIGSWSEKWNLETDNTVTQSTPSISFKNEVYPDGSGSTIETLFGDTYIGNRVVVLIGYQGFALADFITIYDGRLDDIEVDGEDITLTLKRADLPSTHIGGREINGQLIGDDDYSASITIPAESDGKFLPVPFGNHWNAPIVLYRKSATGETSWAYCDFDWSASINTSTTAGVRPIGFKRDNLWSSGDYDDQLVILVPNEGKLAPCYQLSHRGYTVYTLGLDAGTSSTVGRFIVDAPTADSEAILNGQEIVCNVPLRLYRLSGTGHAADFNNISPSPSESNIDNILDDNISSGLTGLTQGAAGTWSEIIFNAIVDLPKQLRSDLRYCVNSQYPIHIPQPVDSSGGDQYTMLVFGKFVFSGGDGGERFRSHNYLFAFEVGNDRLTYDLPDPATASTNGTTGWMDTFAAGTDWEHFIGATFAGRGHARGLLPPPYYPPSGSVWENGGQDDGYHYWTHTRLNNAGALIVSGNRYSFTEDTVGANGVADAGNGDGCPDYASFDLVTEEMLTLPYLRRDALDKGVGFRVELRWNDIQDSTDAVEANYYAFYLEAIETIPFDWEEDKYTFLKGYQDEDYSGQLSTFDAEFADETYQYLEAIIRRKVGAASGDMHSSWSNIALAYSDFFASDRTGSGFVTPTDEELPFDEFVKEYCKYEPFTVYRDQTGKYRFLMLPIDEASIESRTYFTGKTDSIDYNRCDLGFSVKMTDKKLLCSEVKSCKTDRIYFDDTYVQDQRWKLNSVEYDFGFWESDNTYADNRHFLKELEKPFTSSPTPSIVVNASDSTKGYCCRMTNEGTLIPLVRSAEGDVKYWEPLAGTSSDWGSPTTYTASGQAGHWVGWDAENKAIASYWINQWCNRHRIVTCSSTYAEWLKYELGDFVAFTNVPYTCHGLTISGWNGDTTTDAVEVNGQNVLRYFVITSITKSLGRVTIEAMQLHELDAFITVRHRKVPAPYDNRARIDSRRERVGKLTSKIVRKLRKR